MPSQEMFIPRGDNHADNPSPCMIEIVRVLPQEMNEEDKLDLIKFSKWDL